MTPVTPSEATAPTSVRETRPHARLWPRLALVVVLLGALLIRVDFIHSAYYFKDDHGTAALMSLHILQGRETPLYFYGYHYVAALGAYVGALMFAVFGMSPESLCLAMVPFALLWVFATYLLFGRLVGRWGGVLAAALVAFAPFTVMWYSVVPLLGYPTTFAFGTLIVYFGARLNARPISPRTESWCLIGLAAVAGIAIWNNPLCASYLVIGFGLLVAHVVREHLRRGLLIKLLGASVVLVVALAPVIMTALQVGVKPLFGFRAHRSGLIETNVELVGTYYVEELLFKGSPLGVGRTGSIAAYALAAAGFVGAFVVGIVGAVRGRRARVRGRRARAKYAPLLKATLVPLAFVLVYAAMFLPSPMAATRGPRFFVPFYLGVCAIFAAPLALRWMWSTTAAGVLAGVVIAFNIATHIHVGHGKGSGAGARRMAEMEAFVNEVERAGLRYVMVDDLEGHPLTFVAREKTIFVHSYRERYYPYAVDAAASDETAIAKHPGGIPAFRETLRTLGVTAPEPIVGAKQAVFYGFAMPTQTLRVVEPKGVSYGTASLNPDRAEWLIDRNEETWVCDRFDAKGTIIVDFGEAVEIGGLRLVAEHEWDYPVALQIMGTLGAREDDEAWLPVETVKPREASTYIAGNRLYHRGELPAMECRFSPVRVRYLRLDGFRPPKKQIEEWGIQEAYFYAPAGERGLPDENEAADISMTLAACGVTFAYCDEWLSRRIERLPPPRPGVLPHYDSLHLESMVSRTVSIRDGVAIVVENAHADECGRRIEEATVGEVSVQRIEFPHYTALAVTACPGAYADFGGLKWDRFTLVGTACVATAAWYQQRGESLEREGDAERARRYYHRAFETFAGIPANLDTLAPTDAEARATLEKLTPQHETPVRFSRSVRLVGYSIEPATLVAGERATLQLVWEFEGSMPGARLPVFVHFLDEETIRFQADHAVRLPVLGPTDVPRCRLLDEHTFVVSADCPSGEMIIRLGVLNWRNTRKRLKPTTDLPVNRDAVEIGRIDVIHSSGG
ncbi:MAG: hypothetical protein JW889_07795 [Verrucomicrobia bacterium]|nr:hypothetical protein [Verrucomicrobiota bacterium]